MKNKKVRLRYAPSPTGKLHLGGARTALFNYLYAKHNDGLFIVRIEDTDLERNIKNGEEEQINNLKWLGIKPDIYPNHDLNIEEFKLLRQSERLNIYKKYVDFLLKEGKAYKCYCSKEELELERENQLNKGIKSPKYSQKCFNNEFAKKDNVDPVIRLHIPPNLKFSWNDGVRGNITVDSGEIEDWIIQKSNGMPTYNFANVIDDHLMGITHIMRGEEHISNTPKQIYLYQLFNWDVPNFIHLTIIIGENNKKLSKRDESIVQFISEYRSLGYLPHAIFNFLSLLGWSSPKLEEEIFSKEEIIDMFSLERLSKSPSKFDLGKLRWMNNYYIQLLNEEELYQFLNPFLSKELKEKYSKEEQILIINQFKEQLHEGIELLELSNVFVSPSSYKEEELSFLKSIDLDLYKKVFLAKFDAINEWNIENLKQTVKDIGLELNLKGRPLFRPIRILVSGSDHGPNLMQMMSLLGKREVIKRIKEG